MSPGQRTAGSWATAHGAEAARFTNPDSRRNLPRATRKWPPLPEGKGGWRPRRADYGEADIFLGIFVNIRRRALLEPIEEKIWGNSGEELRIWS